MTPNSDTALEQAREILRPYPFSDTENRRALSLKIAAEIADAGHKQLEADCQVLCWACRAKQPVYQEAGLFLHKSRINDRDIHLCLASPLRAAEQAAPPALETKRVSRKRFEYLAVRISLWGKYLGYTWESVDVLGAEGWELVFAGPWDGDEAQAYFKRELAATASQG